VFAKVIQCLKLLKLHKALGRCVVKCVLFHSDQHTRCTETGILNCICSHYHILSTAQNLPHNDPPLYAVSVIVSFYYNLANAISKLPRDGAEAPKHVGAFVIQFVLIYVCAFVGTNDK